MTRCTFYFLEDEFNSTGIWTCSLQNDKSNPSDTVACIFEKTDDRSDNHAVGMTPHLNLQMIRSHQSQPTPHLIAIADVIPQLGQSVWPCWLQSERWPGNWWWISVQISPDCFTNLCGMRYHCWRLNFVAWELNLWSGLWILSNPFSKYFWLLKSKFSLVLKYSDQNTKYEVNNWPRLKLGWYVYYLSHNNWKGTFLLILTHIYIGVNEILS